MYYSIILSSILYTSYMATQNVSLRILAFVFVIIFYFKSFIYVKRIKYWVKDKGNLVAISLNLYIVVMVINIILSLNLNEKDLITLFFHPYSFLAFYISIVLLTVQLDTFEFIFRLSKRINNFVGILIIIDLVIFEKLVLVNELCYFTIIEILFFDKLKKQRILYLLLILILEIYLENLFVNRTLVIRLVAIPITFYLFNFINILQGRIFKYGILAAVLLVIFYTTFQFEEVFDFITSNINKNIGESKKIDMTDTRTFIFLEAFEQFDLLDIIFGRGFLGTYYSDYFHLWQGDNGDSATRFTIEVGILDIILKGGTILLTPFLILFLISINKGFVKNHSYNIDFRLSIFVLIDFLLLSIENCPSFSVHYLLLWLFIGIILRSQNLHINYINLKRETT